MKQNRVTSKDGTRIAFDRSGHGPKLILVGGALSERSGGAPLVKLLAPRFTVVSYDRRGRDRTSGVAVHKRRSTCFINEGLDIFDLALDGIWRPVFTVASALEATAKLPAKVRKLSLYEPPFIIDDSRPLPPENFVEHINELIAADRRGDAVEFWMTDVVGAPAEAVAQMPSTPTWPALEAVAHTLPYDIAVLGDNMVGKPLPA